MILYTLSATKNTVTANNQYSLNQWDSITAGHTVQLFSWKNEWTYLKQPIRHTEI